MATEQIASPFADLQGIFDKIIGTRTRTEGSQQLDLTNLINTLKNETSRETGSTTSNQQANTVSQLLSALTGNTTSNTSNTQTTNADVGALRDVYARQAAGVTPDMLAAIFREGAKAAPQLVSTTANAVGARPGANSPLALAMTQLNEELVGQAASLNTKMLSDAGSTATQIANLTKSVTDTGSNVSQQTQNKTDSTSGSTTTTGTQQIQKLIEQLTNQTQNQTQSQNKLDESTTLGGINQKQTGIAAGLAGLASLLSSTGLGSQLGSGLNGIIGQIGKWFEGGSGGAQPPYMDPGGGGGGVGEWWEDPGYEWDFADGGLVKGETLKLSDSKKADPNKELMMLLALLGKDSGAYFGSGSGANGANGSGSGSDNSEKSDGPGTGGSDGSPTTTDSSSVSSAPPGFSTPVSSPISMSQMANIALSVPLGPMAVLSKLLPVVIAKMQEPSLHVINPAPAAPQEIPSIDTSGFTSAIGVSSPTSSPVGSVTVGALDATQDSQTPDAASQEANAAVAAEAVAESIGIAMGGGIGDSSVGSSVGVGAADGTAGGIGGVGGDGSEGSGAGGSSGADAGGVGAGDGGDGGGWADGGYLPSHKDDPEGNNDGININVSGGEYIIPKDVVDLMGVQFFDSLKLLHHTPALRK